MRSAAASCRSAKGPFEIGRRETNDLRLAGSEVSRDHAEIAIDGSQFVLHDRNSRYGTYVNGEQVTERAWPTATASVLAGPAAPRWCSCSPMQPPVDRATTTAIGDLRQIAALLEGLRALGSGRVLDDVLALVLDSAIEVSGAERGFIMLAHRDAVDLEFKMARARGQTPAWRQLRDQPQDSRGGVPHRRAAASSPTCSTATWPTCTWARSRSASATCCASPLRLVRYVDEAEERR